MCGRFHIGANDKEIADVIDRLPESKKNVQLRLGDIYPTNYSPAFTSENEKPSLLKWGFQRFDKKSVLINARAETVTEKYMFKNSFLKRRCAIPASGFYEWDSNKNKYYFKRTDGKPIYLCGFFKPYDNFNGFVILTKEATQPVAKFHNRIPVMADDKTLDAYLGDALFARQFVISDSDIKLQMR